jgi:hypothetical protein
VDLPHFVPVGRIEFEGVEDALLVFLDAGNRIPHGSTHIQ